MQSLSSSWNSYSVCIIMDYEIELAFRFRVYNESCEFLALVWISMSSLAKESTTPGMITAAQSGQPQHPRKRSVAGLPGAEGITHMLKFFGFYFYVNRSCTDCSHLA